MSRGTVHYLPGSKALELKHLRLAATAANCGSFRKAAELLRLQQSTLSRSIRQIEHHLGVTLFERSSGGVNPTAAGRLVLRLARTILEELDTLIVTARSAQNSKTGRLAVGFCTSLSAGNLQASLLEFKQRFPSIELAMVERSRACLATALRNRALDVLIVTGSVPLTDCKTRPLWSERVLLVIPQNHPLTRRETTNWTDLRGETVLLSNYDPGRELEELLISKLLSPEDRPKFERHHVSTGVIKHLIGMKAGISVVLESDFDANFADLVYRELRDDAGPSRFEYSAYWRTDNENPTLDAFLELLAERYPSPRLGR